MAFEDPNIVGVELVADPATAEARIERFTQVVAEADRVMQQAGSNASFGDAFAQQTQKAQAGIEETAKASADAGAVIDKSYTQGADAVSLTQKAVEATNRSTQTYAQTLRETQLQARAAGEEAVRVNKAVEQTAKAAAVAYRASDNEVESLRKRLRQTRDEAYELQRALASQGKGDASFNAATIARRAERGLETIDADTTLATFGRVDAFSRGSRGRLDSLKETTSLRDAARDFNRETEKSLSLTSLLTTNIQGVGTPLAGIVSGLLGGALITTLVSGIVEIGSHYVEAYEEARKAQQGLINLTVQTGGHVREQIQQVDALKGTYQGLTDAILANIQASAQAAREVPITQQTAEDKKTVDNEATRALRELPDQAISEAALTAGRRRGLEQEEIAKALRELSSGNPQGLLGISDAEAQARFAGVIDKLPEAFTEEEKKLARVNVLLTEAGPLYESAAKAAAELRDTLATRSQSERPSFLRELIFGNGAEEPGIIGRIRGDAGRNIGYEQSVANSAAFREQQTREDLERLIRRKQGKEDFDDRRKDFYASVAESDKRREQEVQQEKRFQEQVREARKDAEGFLNEMAQRADRDNPFVKLFGDAETAAERMQKRFGKLGEDVVAQMTAVELKALEMERTAARIQSSQKVFDIENEIRTLKTGPIGLTAEDDRQRAVQSRELEAARKIPDLLARADALLKGQGSSDPDRGRVLNEQYDKLVAVSRRYADAAPGVRAESDAALTNFYERLSPQERQAVAAGRTPALARSRDEFAAAYRRNAAYEAQQVEDETRRAEVGRFAVDNAQQKLADLRRFGGFDDDNVRKQYLAVTGALGERELTPELRRGRIDALDAEAKKEASKESDAAEFRKEVRATLKRLDAVLSERGLKLDEESADRRNKVEIEVFDRTNQAKVSVLGEEFK